MISIIICSIDQRKFDAVCRNYAELLRGRPHEIIGVHDARSLCSGYNRGIERSRGDVLIFSHDDIEIISPDFAERLTGHLERHDLIGVAGTTRLTRGTWISAGPPYIFGQVAHVLPEGQGYAVALYGAPRRVVGGVQAVDGLFFAARRSVIQKVRFDEQTFDGFHFYDLDFSYAAYRAGLSVAVANDIHIIHASGGKLDERWQHYGQRFVSKYPSLPRSERPYTFAQVAVRTRQEVLEVMNATTWDEARAA